MTSANGTSASQSDRHAAIDYLKRLKAGEKAERPTIHDGRMVDEIGQAEHMVTMAGGNLSKLSLMYQSVASVEIGGKPRWPLFAEVMAEEEENKPVATCLQDVESEDISWLWHPYIPMGALTALDGDPGLGKTTLMIDTGARYSRGWAMPGEERAHCKPGSVISILIEDGLKNTIKPRFERAGADLSRIHFLGRLPMGEIAGIPWTRTFNLQTDIPLLIREIRRTGAGLVLLDPLFGLVGKVDTNSNEISLLLSQLYSVAEVMGIAILFTRHFNKREGTDTLYRGTGYIGIIGTARAGLGVVRDKDNPKVAHLGMTKNNLDEMLTTTLSYSIVSDKAEGDKRAYVQWHGLSENTMDDLMGKRSEERLTEGAQAIMKALRDAWPASLSRKDITERTKLKAGTIGSHLSRLEEDGLVSQVGRGLYIWPEMREQEQRPDYESGLQQLQQLQQ